MKPGKTAIKIILFWFLAAAIIVIGNLGADASNIQGRLQICAYPFNCIGRTKNTPSGYGPYIIDKEGRVGPGNNWAEAEYLGDIAKGYLGAWSRATRGLGVVHGNEVWCPARAATYVSWQAAIQFRVEPGSYPAGLTAQATVVAKGRVSKYGAGTVAKASYYASFGNDYHSPPPIELESYHPSQAVIIDDEFTLTATLVPPGTVLENHLIVEILISAGLGGSPPLIATTWAGGINDASALSDFAFQKYLRFISISVPPEVTWTSADGFLTMPSDACRGDFDKDGDVDGSDLAELTLELAHLELILFAARYGRTDCQPW